MSGSKISFSTSPSRFFRSIFPFVDAASVSLLFTYSRNLPNDKITEREHVRIKREDENVRRYFRH